MAGASSGALVRSIRAMTIGNVKAHQSRRDDYDRDKLGELDVQFQIPVSGTAGALTWQDLELTFDTPFIDAYDERQSPYHDPLFTTGAVVRRGDALLIANVREWVIRDELYMGARLRIGVIGNGEFVGEVHLNFQGYGTPHSDNADTGEAQ